MYQRVMKDYLGRERGRERGKKRRREGRRERGREGRRERRRKGRGADSVLPLSVEVCVGGGFPSPGSGRRGSLEEKKR